MELHRIAWLRRLVLPVFARVNPGDITVTNPFSHMPIRLHSFRHKAYWFRSHTREKSTMERFRAWVQPGSTVLEIGAHIGFVTQYFATLAGPGGRVIAFEPGPNNLPYLERNIARCANVALVRKAAADANGTTTFYIEDLSGQNNSLNGHFDGLDHNSRAAGMRAQRREVPVEIVRLDDYIAEHGLRPSFIKIDVEGAEDRVLDGLAHTLATLRPRLMVEVNPSTRGTLRRLLANGYRLSTPEGVSIPPDEADTATYNVFAEPG